MNLLGSRTAAAAAGSRHLLHSGRLKSREAAAAMRDMEFRSSEVDAIAKLVPEAQKVVKMLKGRKTNAPKDAYFYLASLPPEMLAFIEVEMPNASALSKIRNYMQKWRPMRLALPVAELDALGVPRGAKFDKILEDLFEMQLRGRGREPEQRTKILRQLAGIKDEPKKVEKEKKKRKEKEVAGKTCETRRRKTHEKGKPAAAGHATAPLEAKGAAPAGSPATPKAGTRNRIGSPSGQKTRCAVRLSQSPAMQRDLTVKMQRSLRRLRSGRQSQMADGYLNRKIRPRLAWPCSVRLVMPMFSIPNGVRNSSGDTPVRVGDHRASRRRPTCRLKKYFAPRPRL